jgi:hypothetical protein
MLALWNRYANDPNPTLLTRLRHRRPERSPPTIAASVAQQSMAAPTNRSIKPRKIISGFVVLGDQRARAAPHRRPLVAKFHAGQSGGNFLCSFASLRALLFYGVVTQMLHR